LTAGFQQLPADRLQGTGAGMTIVTERVAALPDAGTAASPRTRSPSDSNETSHLARATRAFISASFGAYPLVFTTTLEGETASR
jgi:hypothetical protein